MNAPTSNGFLMGLDAGTSVVKAAIFDQAGNEMSRGARTVPIVNPEPHLAEEDMDLVWEAAAGAIQDALVNGSVRAEEILAVCATGQGDGSWMVGPDGKPAGPAILWTDGRTGDLLDQWYDSGAVAKQFPISGTGPYAGTTSALLRWRQDNEPALLAPGNTNLWCKDWVEYGLTGDLSTDPSDASLAGIDVRARTWSEDVFDILGIDQRTRDVLPALRNPTEQCGTVTRHAAGVTGLIEGTPVFKGQMDITASSLGVGVARPGDCMAVIGTAGIVTVATNDLSGDILPPDVGWVIPHGPDTWVRGLGMNCCTPNVDWFLREFGEPFRSEAAAQPGGQLFSYLDQKIAQTPIGSGGVIFHGYLAPGGERAPFVKPSARGSFNGLTGGHDRWHMLRAVYEGVAYGIRDCLDAIPTPVDTVRMAGGGANSPVWSQIFADVLNRRIIIPAGTEFGAKGAAIVGGVGLGIYDSYEAGADATVTITREYEPNPQRAELYTEFFEVYRSLRASTVEVWDQLQSATRKASAFVA
ncbi:FGGY family carbohydrate kinase [Branchiibius cervicis]|uniref:FGGY family carbohydrate kinase n=1 Tax=Branchiibius cervicis TaxID=908252 RepID=A0ABW2ASV4_9MICO